MSEETESANKQYRYGLKTEQECLEEHIKRNASCVNACRSLSTSALESGVVEKMVENHKVRCAACMATHSMSCYLKEDCNNYEILKLLGSK